MLQRIALLAIAAPRRILVVALLVMVACGIFGVPVAGTLSAGGFQDPTSESALATRLLVDEFDQGDMELIISVTDEAGVRAGSRSRRTSVPSPRRGVRHRPPHRLWSARTARPD